MSVDRELVEKLLKTDICYLSTSDLQGNPHIKPIWFVFSDGKIWFETDLTTKAFKNIKQNNKIALCFGGRETYLVWGKLKWYSEQDAPVQYRKMLWEKYGKDMNDSFITENTGIFEVVIEKERAWHYADKDWKDLDLS